MAELDLELVEFLLLLLALQLLVDVFGHGSTPRIRLTTGLGARH
jgi:hypothetical protein